jgi:hypothetical protein
MFSALDLTQFPQVRGSATLANKILKSLPKIIERPQIDGDESGGRSERLVGSVHGDQFSIVFTLTLTFHSPKRKMMGQPTD